jgi:peptidoglycan/xylan/chitin deacetylase (PgdA/CDA1 family)
MAGLGPVWTAGQQLAVVGNDGTIGGPGGDPLSPSVANAASDAGGNVQDIIAGGTSVYALRDSADRIQRHVTKGAYGDIFVPQGIPVVCLGSDDSPAADWNTIWPVITANNLPWTLNTVVGGNFYPSGAANPKGLGAAGYLTWAQLQTMRDYGGVEVACHSRTHTDPTANGGVENFVDETFKAAQDLRAGGGTGANFNVDLFCQPGTWTGSYNFQDISQIDPVLAGVNGPIGGMSLPAQIRQWLMATFAATTAYAVDDVVAAGGGSLGNLSRLPITSPYGLSRNVDFTTTSLATLQNTIQYARGLQNALVCIYGHGANLGVNGFTSIATFTSMMQYLAAQRDAGNITLLTTSAALRAQPSANGRENLLLDGDFHLDTPGTIGSGGALVGWKYAAGAPTIVAAGAQVGAAPPGNTASIIINSAADQVFAYFPARQLRQVRIEFDARVANGAARSTQNQRLIWRGLSSTGATMQNVDNSGGGATGPQWPALTSNWTHYVMMAGVDPQSVTQLLWPYINGGGGGVEYANFKVYKQ